MGYSSTVNKDKIELILARPEHPLDNSQDLIALKKAKVLITGGRGSLGQEVVRSFESAGVAFALTDIEECDVTNFNQVDEVVQGYQPTHILHLAADKHAPEGELFPESTLSINTLGTINIFNSANKVGAKVVIASTCKSCDPETVYGSSKLIAERIALNNNGTVARFYNVVNTQGNVYEIWDNIPVSDEIKVADCYRYFISADEARSLLVRCVAISATNPGRYIFQPGVSHFMPDIAQRLYPNRKITHIPPRRGDRRIEPLSASSERLTIIEDRLCKVYSPHDPEPQFG